MRTDDGKGHTFIKSNNFPDTPINAPFIEYVNQKIADIMFIPKDRLNNKKE